MVKHQLTGNVIKKISTRNFELYSPREYNFTTDKLIINVEFRLRALEHWCLKDKPEEFDKYLKENYSSYDALDGDTETTSICPCIFMVIDHKDFVPPSRIKAEVYEYTIPNGKGQYG